MTEISQLVFVWNADFSLGSGVRALREAVEGHHSCSLCGIAYHRVRQTGDWKAFKKELRQQLGTEIREPCRNQLSEAQQLAAACDYPTALAHTTDGIVKLLDSQQIDACGGSFELFRERMDGALASLQQVR